eukprot:Plantae.Rhodophyta-Purpureofilum_apyrenoidigerum.ctg15406.p1 GENE.Plantae.Rhodophyta-Purpureofilum_apyrenoidigerum.ctg15406~~Plantae.Rhodophyta-Purpureofilum_apyrenoidigerum.ctg15406.p1  ORF type:complete len:286 (-),score=34.27 Plantae.Rhodophyta-Purpureofilum_apyrenoidigerum.ctg15406:997-1854(-)
MNDAEDGKEQRLWQESGRRMAFLSVALPSRTRRGENGGRKCTRWRMTATKLAMERRAAAKRSLRELVDSARKELKIPENAPVTNVKLDDELNAGILRAVKNVEVEAPTPRPLQDCPMLLDGVWRLLYSDAREITFLAKLPFGFYCRDVFQVINVGKSSFVNMSVVDHVTNLLKGFVMVTAMFSARPGPQFVSQPSGYKPPGNFIRVQFQKRSFHLTRVAFVSAPQFLSPFKVMIANATGRTLKPSLTLTYLDDDLRIGRSPSGIYVLEKLDEIPSETGIDPKFLP